MDLTEPTEDERVQHVVVNVRAMNEMVGVVRDYDLLFTENGILFADPASARGDGH